MSKKSPPGFSKPKEPPPPATLKTAAEMLAGPPIDPAARIVTYDSSQWEGFVEEWLVGLAKKYKKVLRYTGAGDKGIDVAGFRDDKYAQGSWDAFQCKHYSAPIGAATAFPEIGKVLWYAFNGDYKPPEAYFFVAPRGISTQLMHLFSNTPNLKARVKADWDKKIKTKITATQEVPLTGPFAAYVESFDFSIFQPTSVRDVIEQHAKTKYHVGRFGGGLGSRPIPSTPPSEIAAEEGKYVAALLGAYADHKKAPVPDAKALKPWKELSEHFNRQRVHFYHAESLRVFVRDKVEPGTFESLQDEVFEGVVDIADSTHVDGFERVKAVTEKAQDLPMTAHPLGAATFGKDKRGICHQLVNEDRLKWT